MSEHGDELRKQFRGEVPASVHALDPADARDLAAAMRAARVRQTTLLAESTEASLRQLPRLLRPVVRKVLGL